MNRVSRYQVRLYDDRDGKLIAQLDAHLDKKAAMGVPANFALAELLAAGLAGTAPDTNNALLTAIQALQERLDYGIIQMARVQPVDPEAEEPAKAARGLDAALARFQQDSTDL